MMIIICSLLCWSGHAWPPVGQMVAWCPACAPLLLNNTDPWLKKLDKKKRERREGINYRSPQSPPKKKRQRYSTGGLCQAAEAHHPTKMTPPNGHNCLIACSYHLWADLWWTSLIFVRSLSMSTMQGWAVSDNRNVLTFLIPVLEPRLDWFFFYHSPT